MEENPYKAPQAAEATARNVFADHRGMILRLLIAWQIVAITISGLWARDELTFAAFAGVIVRTIPITAFAAPVAVICLAIKEGPGKFLLILLTQIALWASYVIAMLPSVQ